MLKKLGHPLGCRDVAVDGAEGRTTDAFGTLARFHVHLIAASPVRPFPTPMSAVWSAMTEATLFTTREYRALARTVLGGVARPVILVDWADSALAYKQLILKAAVPVKGRANSIYEEVHPMRRYNNAGTHRRFLHRLQSILPEGCCPSA